MKILISTDLEGCAGIFHRELQISSPASHEFARTLRICTGEVVAAINGARAAGATDIVIHAVHDIDPEMLPSGIQFIRGTRPWDNDYFQSTQFDALILVGQHGGAHLTDCALAHTFLPSWQIEASAGSQEGWIKQVAPQLNGSTAGEFSTVEKIWLNDRLVGESSVIMTMAAAHGVPTVGVAGCIHACKEARALVPQVETIPVKWCIAFRAAQMLSPAGAKEVVREGIESALQRRSEVPLLATANEPQEIKVRYVHPGRANRTAQWPGTRRLDEKTVAATAPNGKEIPGLRFMFARPSSAEDELTSIEDYQPPSWLEAGSQPDYYNG